MYLCTSQKTSKRLFDWQVLKVFLVPEKEIAMFGLILLFSQLVFHNFNFVNFTFLADLSYNTFFEH